MLFLILNLLLYLFKKITIEVKLTLDKKRAAEIIFENIFKFLSIFIEKEEKEMKIFLFLNSIANIIKRILIKSNYIIKKGLIVSKGINNNNILFKI